MFRQGSKIAIIVFTLLMDLHSICISLIFKHMIFNMNSKSNWTLIYKLLTSIRPVVSRPVQCRQHTVNVSSTYDVLIGPAMTPRQARCLRLLLVWKTVCFLHQALHKLLPLTTSRPIQSSTSSTFLLSNH